MAIVMDDEHCYRAVQSRDPRFDGWFFGAVTTTGIYCRPSCPAVTPKRENMRFYPTAAAAQDAGFRACKRCRPDATPGSPEWSQRADLIGRAMRLISDGVVDRDGVTGLATRLGYSERHLHRQLVAEVGAGPLALARAQRARAARLLLETTDLPATQVAFAAGFASVRQFNDTVRDVFATTPTGLRAASRSRRAPAAPGVICLRLPFRAPLDAAHVFAFLSARAVPGVEEGTIHSYRRTLGLPHGPAVLELTGDHVERGWIDCRLDLGDLRDLAAAVQRCRRLLDLDADPVAIAEQLGRDPILGPDVQSAPGLRVPGHVDGDELAVRAVIGQQVSVPAARTLAARLTAGYGTPLRSEAGTLTHLFPTASQLADADPDNLPMPRSRKRTLLALARALEDGDLELDPGADRDEATSALRSLPGVGPWTAGYIRMRALGDPDVFLDSDVGVRHALARRGADAADSTSWRPWRSYAVLHLWKSTPSTGSPSSTTSTDRTVPREDRQ
jgi:AraC family transcriptional regulator, regulatory protein of adaptative response / DNA-3-methyladenine glycosylase II